MKGSTVTRMWSIFKTLQGKFNLHATSVKSWQDAREIWACYKLWLDYFSTASSPCLCSKLASPKIAAFHKPLALILLKWINPHPSSGSEEHHTDAPPHTQIIEICFCIYCPRCTLFTSCQCESNLLLCWPSSPKSLLQQLTSLWFFFCCFRNTLSLASWQKKLYCLDVRRSRTIALLKLKRCESAVCSFWCILAFICKVLKTELLSCKMLQECWLVGLFGTERQKAKLIHGIIKT